MPVQVWWGIAALVLIAGISFYFIRRSRSPEAVPRRAILSEADESSIGHRDAPEVLNRDALINPNRVLDPSRWDDRSDSELIDDLMGNSEPVDANNGVDNTFIESLRSTNRDAH
ncbi:MAG: hypothetical protein ACK5LN_12185 [Propioniciclava sp.]